MAELGIVPVDTPLTVQTMTNTLDPEYILLPEYMRISGDGRTTAYEKIADGRLLAVKDGKRLKIAYRQALEHLRSLPKAEIRPAAGKAAA